MQFGCQKYDVYDKHDDTHIIALHLKMAKLFAEKISLKNSTCRHVLFVGHSCTATDKQAQWQTLRQTGAVANIAGPPGAAALVREHVSTDS